MWENTLANYVKLVQSRPKRHAILLYYAIISIIHAKDKFLLNVNNKIMSMKFYYGSLCRYLLVQTLMESLCEYLEYLFLA